MLRSTYLMIIIITTITIQSVPHENLLFTYALFEFAYPEVISCLLPS